MEISRIICFAIGLILCVLGVFVFAKQKKNKNACYYAALIELASHFALLLPNVYKETPLSFARGIESLVDAFLVSVTKYFGEGYDRYLFDSSDPYIALFNSCYNILFTLTNILMLLFAANIILHLIEGPYQEIKLFRRRKGKVYLFSQCNEKTLAIAESISMKHDKNAVLVFAASDEDVSDVHKESIRKIDAILMKLRVEDVYSNLNGKSTELEVFLFNDKEEQNLSQMADITKGPVNSYVRIFAEVNALPWSLYDDYIAARTKAENKKDEKKVESTEAENDAKTDDNKEDEPPKLTINLVRTEENFIYNTLLVESIFEDAVAYKKGVKQIKILIAGYNDRNFEFLKAVLHLGQMPGYELSVVLIEDGDHRDVIKQKIPELYEKGAGYGDAIYTFKHITGISYDSIRFDESIGEECKDFTYAFINVEDDISNLGLAIRTDIARQRARRAGNYRILVNICNRELCNDDKLNKQITENMRIVGGIREVYARDFIAMSSIEKATKVIHKNRYKGKKTWEEYCNNEYNRHSVYARTLSFAFKIKVIDEKEETKGKYQLTTDDDTWIVYEHMRWDMYTRTMGYIKAPDDFPREEDGSIPGKIRKALKIHQDLVPFDQLPVNEKKAGKDKLELTDEIIESLNDCTKKKPKT